MNPSLLGFPPGAAGASSGNVRLRNPFDPDEANISGIRLGTCGTHAFQTNLTAVGVALRDMAYSPSLDIAVAVGHIGTVTTPTAATTGAYSSVDGINWIGRTVTSGIYPTVYWTGSVFIAQANGSTAWQSSSNGITWTVGSPALPANNLILRTFNGKLYGLPTSGTTYYEFTNTNANAAPTNRVALTNYQTPVEAVVACGALITSSGTSIRYSYDGVAWSVGTSPGLTVAGLWGNSSLLIAFNAAGQYNISYNAGLTWEFLGVQVLDFKHLAMFNKDTFGSVSVPVTSYNIGAIYEVYPIGNIQERMGFIVSAQFSATTTIYNLRMLVHTSDGLTWTAEHPHVVAGTSVTINDHAGCGMKDRFVIMQHNDSAATNYMHITSPQFKELVYVV